MTGLITKAALLSACGMLVAAAAMAGLPSASTSTSPAFIRLVSQNSVGVPDAAGGNFTITVRDIAANPVIGSNVVVDFSGCTPIDIRIASNQQNANYTTNCATHSVSAFTDVAGQVSFTLIGSSFVTASHTGLACARIYADGVLLSSPTVATWDLDGGSGTAIGDLGVWLGDLGAGGPLRARSDYDTNGAVAIGDLGLWLGRLGAAGGPFATTYIACP